MARAERVAAALRARGVTPGERLAIVLPTGPEFFDACFGAILAGAAPAPLCPPLRLGAFAEYHRRTAAMLAAAGARRVVGDRRLARLLGQTVAASGPGVELLIAEELLAEGATAGSAPPRNASPEDLALVQFSSGTTVDPKPVALSHRAVLAQIEMLNALWRHLPGAGGVSWLPLYHDMGWIGCVFPAAALGAELTLIPPEVFVAWPAIWLRTISRHGAAISAAPNFAYALCADRVRDEELADVELGCWRVALDGAETVVPAVLRRFAERFARWGFRPEALAPVYGLAEATLAVTCSALAAPFASERFGRAALAAGRAEPDREGIELASVGRPLPGCGVEPRDRAGQALPGGHVGRLWIRTPSLMSGYFGRSEATAAVVADGWLDTGDLGFLHRGELYLTGRAKDLVILRGRNYLPQDLESALEELPGVRPGGVAAVSHLPEGGEREELLLFVEVVHGWQGETAALAETSAARLLERTDLAADEVLLVAPGTLPRTSSGKIRRAETLARHLAGSLAAPESRWIWRRGGTRPEPGREASSRAPTPTDVVIVGGGPIGLATAIACRARGLAVTVLERSRPPIDKACGEGVMPDGLAALARLGVRLEDQRSLSFVGIRYVEEDLSAEAPFPAGAGRVVRRTILHEALAERAAEVGVELRWNTAVEGIGEAQVRTATSGLAARWIVGADGLHSRVRRWAGLAGRPARRRRFGVRRHYRVAPWTDKVEVHWTDGCEAYVSPVTADEVGIALLWSGETASFDELLARFPRLRARVGHAAAVSRDRGAGPLDQRPAGVAKGRVALVGDAAGYRDAITGEGLSLGIAEAEALAAALAAGDLASYARGVRRRAAVPFALIRALLFFERRPRLRRRLLATLAAEPELFARLLAIHVRERPVTAVGWTGAGRLLWGLIGRDGGRPLRVGGT